MKKKIIKTVKKITNKICKHTYEDTFEYKHTPQSIKRCTKCGKTKS